MKNKIIIALALSCALHLMPTAQAALPTVTTLAVSNLTATTVMLNGTVNPNSAASKAWFQYGLTTNYGNYSATNTLVATNITLNVTNLLSGLAPGTLYHSRLVATNSAGIYYGNDITLTTLSLDTQFVNPNNPSPAFPYSSWVNAATNIQDAINAAVAGNTVLVTNGVYGVGTTPDDQAYDNRVLINKAITVRSVNGPSFTTIIGGSSIRCVWMTNGALLAGFTLTNGNVTSFGGGVYAASSQVVISNCWITGSRGINAGGVYRGTLYDCTLTNNYATGDGGGGYSNTLYRCTLIGNTSDGFGGGLSYGILSSCLLISNKTTQFSSDGGGANASTLTHCTLLGNNAFNGGGVVNSTLDNCALSNNTARSYGGGGISSTLSACTLFGNKSQKDGGGAHTCTLTNCTLSNNTAGTSFSGGGAYSSTLDNCLVISNTATYGGGVANGTLLRCKLLKNTGTSQGGGGKSAAMNNCLIAGNTSVEGGGAYNGYFTNCTIAGNSTTYRGGGLYNASAVNCIVYLNTGGSVNYLNYYFGVFGNSCTLPLPSSGSGNIDTDPQFVNAGIDDYHLQASSPCRNTGDNAYVTTALDLDANPRIIAAIVDMGAYESQVTNAPVAFSLTGTPLSAGGGFQLSFTNLTGLGFTALSTTNLAVPLTNWTVLGPVAETPAGSGNYQFNDTQNTNRSTQFYRVRSP